MKTRKSLALLLALAMVLGMFGMSALATNLYTPITVNGLTMQFGDPTATQLESPEQNISLAEGENNTVIVTYSGIANYYPDTLAFYVTSGATSIASFSTDGGVTAQPTEIVNGEIQPTTNVTSGFYILTVNTANTGTTNITRTLTITKANGGTVTLQFTIPPVQTPESGTGVMAYLPAGGQFTNEGVTTGGWGDAFTSGGALKAFKNSYSATGISLGAYGGYAVFDFGTPAKQNGVVTSGIYNDATNAYGVDFIVYGNSMGTNAEPGCIQVGVDNDEGGIDWYDIAGSRHYLSDTIWDYEVTYTNPYKTDDALSPAANNLGQQGYGVPYDYNYKTIGGVVGSTVTGSGTVSYNSFHRHSWFPLNCNYFVARYTQSAALAKYGLLSFADYTPYNAGTATAATVTFRGVKLATIPEANPTAFKPYDVTPDTFLFGYADCHRNGTASAAQVNPYLTGRDSGGDPIDISWAVNSDGTPKTLPAIRYVRVYTGQQQMNAINGESSVEVTGIYRATDSGSGEAQNAPTVTIASGLYSATITLSNMGTSLDSSLKAMAAVTGETQFTVTVNDTSADYIYVNGTATTSGTAVPVTLTSGSQMVQVICQTGTRSPFVSVINLT